MSAHPGRDVLLAHVDGELPDHKERAVAAHAAACEECTLEVATIRDSAQLFGGALLSIDDEEPPAWSGVRLQEWTTSERSMTSCGWQSGSASRYGAACSEERPVAEADSVASGGSGSSS
jgi:anti-sigma factor RsiW